MVADWAAVLELAAADADELPRRVPPNRLVADWKAEVAPGADEDFAVDAALELVAAAEFGDAGVELDELSRPKPDRLPRNCGVIRETKFAAAVTPVSRMVFSTTAEETVAVRIEAAVPVGDGPAFCFRRKRT